MNKEEQEGSNELTEVEGREMDPDYIQPKVEGGKIK